VPAASRGVSVVCALARGPATANNRMRGITAIHVHVLWHPEAALNEDAQDETGLCPPAAIGTNPTLLPLLLPIMPILRKTPDLAKIRAGCLTA